jgi:hypothetical protein
VVVEYIVISIHELLSTFIEADKTLKPAKFSALIDLSNIAVDFFRFHASYLNLHFNYVF